MTEETTKLFQTLKNSGENFFDNKGVLDDIRKESETLYNSEKSEFFENISNNSVDSASSNDKINESLFDSLKLSEPSEIVYEIKKKSTAEENKLIKDACQSHGLPDNAVEDIKHALGFISDNQKVDNGKDVQFKKPCVAVVGQTKAGKSALINAFLGVKTVPQKGTRQTARVTYITYCRTKFVAYLRDKTLESITVGTDVKDEDVDLEFEERRLEEKVGIEIRFGVDNPLLQNGFDIVDSPGLNENPALNNLCKTMEKSLLPLLIYVIDGKNGLTETDATDIKSIKKHTPKIQILYFATKLDRSKIDRMKYEKTKAEKNKGSTVDLPGESDVDVANRRLDAVFNKLKKNALIPPSLTRKECRYFNGANLSAIQSFRILGKKPASEIDYYTIHLFRIFEVNLLKYLRDKIEQPLKNDVAALKLAFESFLEDSTICGTDFVEEKQMKRCCLKRFKNDEQKLYDTQSEKIKKELHTELKGMLDQYEQSILHLIHDYEYEKQINRGRSGIELFQYQLEEFVEKSLQSQMEDFIEKFMLKSDELLVDELQKVVGELCSGNYREVSFQIMLKNRLYEAYDLKRECSLTNEKDHIHPHARRENKNRILNFVRELSLNVQRRRFQAHHQNDENPHDASWKERVAKSLLTDIDKENFIKGICSKVTSDLEDRHDNFTKDIKRQENLLNSKLEVGEKEKNYLKEFSQNVAILYLRTYIVETNMHLAFDPLRQPEPLTKGGQATLHKVYLVGHDQALVKKTYLNVFPDFKVSSRVKSLGLEVYYTSRLKDSNFLPLQGIKLETVEGGFKFSSFFHYLPNGSLKEFLEEHNLDIKTRVKLAIDIARGLQCLHEMKIIHRDVTPKNILVEGSIPNLHAVLADFGVLNSLGFAGSDRVGTPFYYPPETYNATELKRTGYTMDCDVFSFSFSLWQLLSYKLRPEYDNFDPQFVIDNDWNIQKIRTLVDNGERPEKRELPPELVYLLEKCWSKNPNERPSFYKPKTYVFPTLKRNYPKAEMTILQILEEIHKDL